MGGSSATLSNGAGFSAGFVGQAFKIDGVDDRVIIPDRPEYNFGPGANLSIEAWLKISATNRRQLITLFDKRYHVPIIGGIPLGDATGYALYLWDGRLGFQLADAPPVVGGYVDYQSAGPDLRDGRFHHVVVVAERANPVGGRLCVDGQVVLTFDPTRQPGDLSNDQPIHLGNHPVPGIDSFLDGLIDEIALYRRALTPPDVASLFAAGASGRCKPGQGPTLADWRFEEGVPGSPVTLVLDASGNGHRGIWINGLPTFVASAPGSQGNVSLSLPPGGIFGSGFGVPDSPAFDLTDNFTLEVAIKPGPNNGGSSRCLIQRGNVDTGVWSYSLNYAGDTGRVQFRIARGPNDTDMGEADFPPDGKSHHVAATYLSKVMKLHLDGVLAASKSTEHVPIAGPATGVYVGAIHNGGLWFDGTMDRVRISRVALAPEQFFMPLTPPNFAANDGIPDSWRQQYFGPDFRLDPRVVATADPDNDGANNFQEFLGGASPVDPKSVPRVPVQVTTWAGSARGTQDGFRTEARFNAVTAWTRDSSGRLWVAEGDIVGFDDPGSGLQRLRIIDLDGMVTTFAGTELAMVDGPRHLARFIFPHGLAFDEAGNLYVLDHDRIRKVDPTGTFRLSSAAPKDIRMASGLKRASTCHGDWPEIPTGRSTLGIGSTSASAGSLPMAR
jgi:hypothetical protein